MFTRCRPYRKNDQDRVEKKNAPCGQACCLVSNATKGLDAAAALVAALYASLRLFVKLLPAVVQAGRQGSRWRADQEEVSPACHAVSAPAG